MTMSLFHLEPRNFWGDDSLILTTRIEEDFGIKITREELALKRQWKKSNFTTT